MEPTFEPQSSVSPRKKAWTKSEVLWGIKETRIAVSFCPVVLGGLGKFAGILGPKGCALSPWYPIGICLRALFGLEIMVTYSLCDRASQSLFYCCGETHDQGNFCKESI